jgi:hypothetical protein
MLQKSLLLIGSLLISGCTSTMLGSSPEQFFGKVAENSFTGENHVTPKSEIPQTKPHDGLPYVCHTRHGSNSRGVP